MCDKYKDKLNIKISSGKQPVGSLSGGNQQKVMIAKWLAINPKIIIMDEPTRGIDVGAKAEIHRLLRELAKNGIGVIMVSSEMPEIIGMCDRVIVMHEGSIKGIVSKEDINEEKIMFYASGKIA
jgi:ribose transport system ATP-binding protein